MPRHGTPPGLALLASALWLASSPAGALEPAFLVAGFARGGLVLATDQGRCLHLDVYFARTPAQRSQGLMHVTAMAEFEGMYFGFEPQQQVVMWMKDTPLPLDILFIGGDGRVAGVATGTALSTDLIPAPAPVAAVLEMNAGFAGRWNVGPASRLLHAYLK